jgi:hypothetical protein
VGNPLYKKIKYFNASQYLDRDNDNLQSLLINELVDTLDNNNKINLNPDL